MPTGALSQADQLQILANQNPVTYVFQICLHEMKYLDSGNKPANRITKVPTEIDRESTGDDEIGDNNIFDYVPGISQSNYCVVMWLF